MCNLHKLEKVFFAIFTKHTHVLVNPHNSGKQIFYIFVHFFTWQMLNAYVIIKTAPDNRWRGAKRKRGENPLLIKTEVMRFKCHIFWRYDNSSSMFDVGWYPIPVCGLAPCVFEMLSLLVQLFSDHVVNCSWMIENAFDWVHCHWFVTSLSFDIIIIAWRGTFVNPLL